MSTLRTYTLRYDLLIIGLLLYFISSNLHFGKDRWKETVIWDGNGYYAYLPAVFIYHDLSFGFFEKIEQDYHHAYSRYDYRMPVNGSVVNKYFCGTAVCLLPFFLGAHAVAVISGQPTDGYSFPYQAAVCLAAIFYLLAGFYFLKKLLRPFVSNEIRLSLLIVVLTFGTNLMYYTVSDAGFSHVYSFFLITWLLYRIHLNYGEEKNNNIILPSVLLALVILVRPVNAMAIAAVPFFSGSLYEFRDRTQQLLSRRPALVASLLLFCSILSVQLIIYRIQTGSFFVYTYGKEGLSLTHPHLLDAWISYKKGFFVYTPLFLLMIPGWLLLYRESSFRAVHWLLCFLLISWVISSWNPWWYGGSLGQRAFIDFYSLLSIPLVILTEKLMTRRSAAVTLIILLALLLHAQLQTWQYRYYILHWEKMDREHYWRVFGRADLLFSKENPNKDLLEENQKQH